MTHIIKELESIKRVNERLLAKAQEMHDNPPNDYMIAYQSGYILGLKQANADINELLELLKIDKKWSTDEILKREA